MCWFCPKSTSQPLDFIPNLKSKRKCTFRCHFQIARVAKISLLPSDLAWWLSQNDSIDWLQSSISSWISSSNLPRLLGQPLQSPNDYYIRRNKEFSCPKRNTNNFIFENTADLNFSWLFRRRERSFRPDFEVTIWDKIGSKSTQNVVQKVGDFIPSQ